MSIVLVDLSQACQRPCSTQTRIKTHNVAKIVSFHDVRDHVPLKQGLRHSYYCNSSLKRLSVRDHVPLKQGLRLTSQSNVISKERRVRDHVPLKQGLRPVLETEVGLYFIDGQRPCSTQTRIKTANLATATT